MWASRLWVKLSETLLTQKREKKKGKGFSLGTAPGKGHRRHGHPPGSYRRRN